MRGTPTLSEIENAFQPVKEIDTQTRFAGRRVGNYNLAKCRDVTDKSDALFAEALGFRDLLTEVELYYAQVVKTDFSNDGEDE